MTQHIGVFPVRLDGEQLFYRDLMQIGDEASFVPRSPESQILRPWPPSRLKDFALKLISRKNKPTLPAPQPIEQPRLTQGDSFFD